MTSKTLPLKTILILIVLFSFTRGAFPQTPMPSFIQPLSFHYNHSDFHAMFYFENHPEYEAVEAMIKEKEMRAKGPLMGEVMKVVRGKIDGASVSKELEIAIKEKLKELK